MYLEKLEIQGFKSFANKNILIFPGLVDKQRRGLTAIVGPNGSGKSNVADAVRWALGEQSMKTLRGKKSEDVIFSGSDKKGQLGMAEVSLYLNNEDRQADLEYSQIVITRRLYRDGENEYILNGNRVRLIDIQLLLAKANFGQKTYSVIGQGMVEGFLNTTLAERKEFFDEATGVKQYQIKRDDALHKLERALENLSQVEMLVTEIEPRLKHLTKQVNRLARREEIKSELLKLRLDYYHQQWQIISDDFNNHNEQILILEKNRLAKEKKLSNYQSDLDKAEREKTITDEFTELQIRYNSLQSNRDKITSELAKLDAWTELKLEAKGQFDVAFLKKRQSTLMAEKSELMEQINTLQKKLFNLEQSATEIQDKRKVLDKQIEIKQQDIQNAKNSLKHDRHWHKHLELLLEKIQSAEETKDLDNMRSLIIEIKNDINKILNSFKSESINISQSEKDVFSLLKQKESLIQDSYNLDLEIASIKTKLSLLKDQLNRINHENNEVTEKMKRFQNEVAGVDNVKHRQELEKQLTKYNDQLEKLKNELIVFNQEQDAKRSKLIALQKNVNELQNEVNDIDRQLNDLKILAARKETKLEDLEKEIRQKLGALQPVIDHQCSQPIDLNAAAERMVILEKQLEQIGGIDAEATSEYQQTKERYEFLANQIKDLNDTINNLEELIKELDQTIKEKFDREYQLIAAKFEEYFKILFNGGQAKIVKVTAEEMLNDQPTEENESFSNLKLKKIKALQKYNATGLAGIEIMATPPGKKIKSVSMLSGGERALTAIALICAIISANPSPFVVLDEVDASLDEANSERLAKILDDLSHKTQFIVITHNRASMRRASILYGVTMQDDGVSKLLSIKLEEASKNI